MDNTVTCHLRVEIAEPEEMSIASQWLSKHVPAAKDTYTTTEELWEVVFSILSMLWLCNEDQQDQV
jgi:hypothetical protein